MSLTAVVVNYNHGAYLEECLASCVACADVVRLYDDASTDNSLEVASLFPSVVVTVNEVNSGSPVWGSSLSIEECETTHLVWVDADNYMMRRPAERDLDYVFHDMVKVDESGAFMRLYRKAYSPTTYPEALNLFLDNPANMPFPWGGVWSMSFLRGRRWRDFETKATAPDYRTSLDWVLDSPTLGYDPEPFLAVRQHEGRMSQQYERLARCREEAASIAEAIRRGERP